jgi:ABC-type phosphate transport system auxiliary subunit
VKLHARLLADKKKEVQKVRRKIESITAQNEDISLRAAEMRESVSDYERIRDGRGGAAGGKDNNAVAAEKKMRSVVAQSKLQHIARAQAEELAVLQDEVERLRLRTFPSFVERTDTVRLPDIHARPTGRRQY